LDSGCFRPEYASQNLPRKGMIPVEQKIAEQFLHLASIKTI